MERGYTSAHKINEHGISEELMVTIAGIDNVSIHFGQSAEDASLMRFFYQQKDGFYVDVGAYDPTRYSNTFILHHFYGWRGINIDPLEKVIQKFDDLREGDINLQSAVGKPGEKTFYMFEASARNTFSEKNVKRQKDRNDTKIVGEEKIKVETLSSILDKHLPNGKTINLLDIDVEGLEMEVLESNNWSKYRPQLILVEDYNVAQGSLTKSEIYNYLRKKGYQFTGHHFDTSFYLDSKNRIPNLPKISRQEFLSNLVDTADKYGAEIATKETIERIKNELANYKRLSEKYNAEITSIKNSTSWRITEPLRRLFDLLRK